MNHRTVPVASALSGGALVRAWGLVPYDETFAAMRLVKSFAREPFEAQRYSAAGEETMNARIGVTWQQSMCSVAISTTTIFGTALVTIVGGLHVMRGEMTIGSLFVVNVNSRAEAKKFSDGDAFTQNGVFASITITRMRKGQWTPEACEGA